MINSVCGIKSTGRICTDIAKELENEGHIVKIAYGREQVPEEFDRFARRIDSKLDVILHGIIARLFDADGLGSRIATKRLIKWIDEFSPDIIHLHNLHGYYINVPILFKYIKERNIKVIWTLHDCWAFTGHSPVCSLVNCYKWKDECKDCPLSHDYPKTLLDFSRRNYRWKKVVFRGVSNLTIVTPSKWLATQVEQSFLRDKKITVIHNGIDLKLFRPLRNDFKEVYGLTDKIVLMGASTAWSDNKGIEDFNRLSRMIDDSFAIVIVGVKKDQRKLFADSIITIEPTISKKEMAMMYSAADVFLNLSGSENYPTVNLEAIACGTFVVTYDSGGSSETIGSNEGVVLPKGDIAAVASYLVRHKNYLEYKDDSERELSRLSNEVVTQEYVSMMGGVFCGKK